MSYVKQAEELYDSHYKGRGIAPRHAAALKAVLAKAFKSGERPKVAARTFLKEKGIVLEDVPEKEKAVEKKPEKAEKASPKKEKAVEKKPEKKEDKFEGKVIDRKLLIGTLKEIQKASGAKLDWDGVNKLDDNQLRQHVHENLIGFADPENSSILDRVEHPEGRKMNTYKLLGDCLGLFVDLRDADCVACADQADCVRTYFSNLRDGYSTVIKKAGLHPVVVEKAAKNKSSGYDPKKMLVVMDVENPYEKGQAMYSFVRAILRRGSMPLAELRELAELKMGVNMEDAEFMTHVKTSVIDAEIGCYAEDLPAEIKTALTKSQKKALGLPL